MIKEKCLELNAYSRPYSCFFVNKIIKSAGGKVEHKILQELIPENYIEEIPEISYNQNSRKVR